MIENHEILCPSFIECDLCQTKRNEINKSRITKLFGIQEDIHILTKHFYHLSISIQPTRETFFRFSLDPLKKVGRELINGLSSLSSVSNRRLWSMYVEKGIRYFSVEQGKDDEYPIFYQHMIFYSQKEDLDVRMNTQLKYRLKKINKHFNYSFDYLGQYNIKNIQDSIKLGVSVDYNSTPMLKLGEEIRQEIYKIKGQRPIVFGGKYNKNTTNKLEIIPS
jgi:hypothetical protein